MDVQDLNTVFFSSYKDNFQDMFLKGFWSALSIFWKRWPHLKYAVPYRTDIGGSTHCAHNIDVQPSALLFPKRDLFFDVEHIEEFKEAIYRLPNERPIRGRRYTNYAWMCYLQQEGRCTYTNLFDYTAMSAWLSQQRANTACSDQKPNSYPRSFRLAMVILFLIFRYIPVS